MSKKLTYEFVRAQFEKEGYKLLSKKYTNNNSNKGVVLFARGECPYWVTPIFKMW